MKHFVLALSLVIVSACSSAPRGYRTTSGKEYAREEEKNRAASLTRSELIAKISALDSQIKAIDQQIETQKVVIHRWEEQDVPSSRAMMENAKVRIKHLQEERSALVKESNELKVDLSAI